MKFVHTADLHIGASPEKNTPYASERKAAIEESVTKIIDLCNESEADLLLIAGDVFNRPPLRSQLKELAFEFSRLIKTRVVFIAGNHDFITESNPITEFDFGDNVYFLSSKNMSSVYFEDIITEVHGLSYHEKNITEPLYDDIKPANNGRIHVLLAHGGEADYIPIHLPSLAGSGFDYVALGHIHQPKVFKDTHMAYSGSPEPLDKTDIGPRGCLLGEITKDKFSLAWHKIAEGEYRNIDIEISPETTQGEIIEKIRSYADEYQKDYLLINIKGSRDPEVSFDLQRMLRIDRVINVTDLTKPAYNIEKIRADHKNDIISHYIDSLKDADDEISSKALDYGLKALLK